MDIIYDIIVEDVISFLYPKEEDDQNQLKQFINHIIGIAKYSFLFFTNIICRSDLQEDILPDDNSKIVEFFHSISGFDLVEPLLKDNGACERLLFFVSIVENKDIRTYDR